MEADLDGVGPKISHSTLSLMRGSMPIKLRKKMLNSSMV